MAPPIKLNDDKIRHDLIALIQAGNYLETAAQAVGIGVRTLFSYLEKGNPDQGEPVEPYASFYLEVQEALALAEARDVQTITKAAQAGDWRAAAWRLERRNMKRWGHAGSQADAAPIKIELTWPGQNQLTEGTVIEVDALEA